MHLERKRAASEVSPEELKRWHQLKRWLGREFQPELADEQSDQRRSVRVP
jgi:hypothetical protein